MNGAQLLIKCLEAEGVDRIWGYPGGAIMPVYDALLDSSIKHYLCRHEQGCGFAAQGYARATGKVACCMATSGPGATNLLTPLADALMDSVPLVAITGQVPKPLIGTDAFQEADVIGLSLPCTKHSEMIERVEDIPRAVREAFLIAGTGKLGPVLLDLPKDVANAKFEGEPEIGAMREPLVPEPDPDQVAAARALLHTSERPILYVGGGIAMGEATAAFRRFVEATGIPVSHTLKGLGGIPSESPLFMGMLGMHGLRGANTAVQECDLLCCIGARFDDRATGKLDEFAPGASVVHIDVDPAELGKLRRPTAAVAGQLAPILDQLTESLGGGLNIEPWRQRCAQMKAEHEWDYDAPFESIYAPKLIRDISLASDENTYACCDVGQHQMWVAQHFRFKQPRQHLTSGGLGTMGFGLPAGIGVQCGLPDARVIVFSGDGSIMMNIQELATIKRYNLPVKIVLLNNGVLGMVRQWQQLFFSNRESEIDLSDNPDFAKVAEAFGIPSMTITRADETAGAIERLMNDPGPLFLHVPIEREANVWPLVPPLKSNSEMIDEKSAVKS